MAQFSMNIISLVSGLAVKFNHFGYDATKAQCTSGVLMPHSFEMYALHSVRKVLWKFEFCCTGLLVGHRECRYTVAFAFILHIVWLHDGR